MEILAFQRYQTKSSLQEMTANKDRLYVGLHARSGAAKMPGGEDKYHWSLIIGPKNPAKHSTGQRHHAKSSIQIVDGVAKNVWVYEERASSLQPTSAMLVCIVIGKVIDGARLREVFAATPVRGNDAECGGWNCVAWVKEALGCAAGDGKALGRCKIEWDHVRDTAMWYVAKKAAEHRFDGQGEFDTSKVPMWDAMEGRELVA
ncbi:hypothetical protein GMOD_00010404 [Pyrenophora seminiperda CCB06]|uniref:Uncharacterized protein n=1 Tax=Pyrenophora seminiperda CCB06 TaxID=1302712 RepID=A0A3M7LZZ3_9PLEO|nr:hypothetical protein GMOD_00010404 [Pyrenophora seminiperda CCB06]